MRILLLIEWIEVMSSHVVQKEVKEKTLKQWLRLK